MLKKTITYTDYNGVERTEDFWFNLNKRELMTMQMGTAGGFAEMIERIIAAQDVPTLMSIFEEIILKAYGEKSADGKQFKKSKELSENFAQTEAYSELFMELVTNSDAAAKFINGLVPADVAAQMASQTPAIQAKN